MSSLRLRAIVIGLALAAAVAACGGSGARSAPAATTSAPTATATASAGASTTATSSGTLVRVSANTATAEEITAALQAAGVPNADRWTREVMEYRPYDTSDPTLQSLQDNLAKYNPSAETLQAILSALKP